MLSCPERVMEPCPDIPYTEKGKRADVIIADDDSVILGAYEECALIHAGTLKCMKILEENGIIRKSK